MNAYIVEQNNQEGRSDYEEWTVGVFATLGDAIKFCSDNDAYNWDSEPIDKNKAYKIFFWEGTRCTAIFDYQGNSLRPGPTAPSKWPKVLR